MDILVMRVLTAYEKSRSNELADEIWRYKHPGEEIATDDREYVSWRNSLPVFLSRVVDAGLGDLDVAFELPTPLGDYIDAALMGSSKKRRKRNPGNY